MDDHLQDPIAGPAPALSTMYAWDEAPEDAAAEAPRGGATKRVLRNGLVLFSVLAVAGSYTLLSASDLAEESVDGTVAPVEPGRTVERLQIAPSQVDGEPSDPSRARVRVWRGTDRTDFDVIRQGRP